jgi:hypothetical protein
LTWQKTALDRIAQCGGSTSAHQRARHAVKPASIIAIAALGIGDLRPKTVQQSISRDTAPTSK